MKTTQTRPAHTDYTVEPGDYICLTDYDGTRRTAWRMVPETCQVEFDSPGEGVFYLGLRNPMTARMLWWGGFGAVPSFRLHVGSKLRVNCDPLGERRPAELVEPSRPGLFRRLFRRGAA